MEENAVRGPSGPVVVVLNVYPSDSETFIQRELEYWWEHGVPVRILALRSPEAAPSPPRHPVEQHVLYAPALTFAQVVRGVTAALMQKPGRAIPLLARVLSLVPKTKRGLTLALRALAVVYHVSPEIEKIGAIHLHAHFLHLPALVTRLLAELLEVSYGVSAHARDIFVPEVRSGPLCREARTVLVCSEHGARQLRRSIRDSDASRIVVHRHGVDVSRMPCRPDRPFDSRGPLRLVSVCRLVPKKGIDTVLRALALLEARGIPFSYDLIGDGPLRESLACLAASLRLRCVRFHGVRPNPSALRIVSESDVMVIGCRVAKDGDQDGVPNAILEAMALGVPVVASDAGGVSEVVRHLETGILVPPDDSEALAGAIAMLSRDQALRERLVLRARSEVEARFDLRKTGSELVSLLGAACSPRRVA